MKMKKLLPVLLCILILNLFSPTAVRAEDSAGTQTTLFFDYSALDDHSGSQYGGWGFGTEKRWGATGNTSDTLQVDTASGTMTLSRTDPHAYSYFYAQTWNADSTTRYPLQYDPTYADYLQVRMKISGFDPAGKNTRFCLNYYIDGSTAQKHNGATHTFGEGYVFDGKYITLQMKLTDAFRSADVVNGIKLNFWDLTGTGTVVFDYVYLGPEAGLPGKEPLYFDFRNTSDDQSRYNCDTYGFQNYDTASAWNGTYLSGSVKDTVRMDNGTGTMTLTKTASNSFIYFYAINAKDLQYRPEQAEYLQVRLKLSGFRSAGKNNSFSLNYYTDGQSVQYTDAASYQFEKGFVFEGEYLTLTLPLGDAFIQSQVISKIKLNFWNLEGTGNVVFDYVYLGSKDGLPSKDYLRFGYVSSEGQGIVAQQNCQITAGVTESTLKFNDIAKGNPAVGFLTTIEPDAEVTFKASYSGYYTAGSTAQSRAEAATYLPWKLERTSSQAAAYEAATGGKVLLAVNADFYNVDTYQPLGYLVMEGNVLQSYGSRQQPFFAVLKDGSFAIRDFGDTIADVEEAVSGVWLVKDGKNVTDTYVHSQGYRENNPMNAIGITADGTVHMFVIDGRQASYSMGMDVNDLSNLFVSLGCVSAIDLDGGGSATYASVHEGVKNLPLRLRNIPSDKTGERAIADALLLVSTEGQCRHEYSKHYVNNNDGTHTVSCQKCSSQITSAHRYVNGKCACGAVEEEPNSLYFEFTNDAEARERYNNFVYGYWNFDRPKGAPWSNNNWATVNNNSLRNSYEVDNTQGVFTLAVTNDSDSRLLAPTKAYRNFPWYNENGSNIYPLNYTPKDAEYFQIRFKTENCTAVQGRTTQIKVHYHYDKDGSCGRVIDTPKNITLKNGTYQILTLKVPEALRDTDLLTTFLVEFIGVTSTDGSIGIDYIYIGSKAELPIAMHTVTFVDGTGKVLDTKLVYNGETAVYAGTTPAKAYDDENHYTWKGWDKALTNITADTTVTATYTATAHSYSYTEISDDNTKHRANCSCGYSRSEGHSYTYTVIDSRTHTVGCENCELTQTVPHSYENGVCSCGEREVKEPIEDVTLKLSHSLNLASDISVNLVVPKTLLAGFDMATVYVESIMELYEGNEMIGTESLRISPVENGNYYYFTLDGLTAVQMNDKIASVLYGIKDGQPYYSPVDEYSIATYAYAQLNKGEASPELKTLCADLLRYGSKAQIFKAYRADSSADGSMTEAHKAYLSDIEAVTFGNTNKILNDVDNAPITWAGKSLDLESKVALKFVFDPVNYKGDLSKLSLKVSYTDIHGTPKTVILEDPDLYNPDRMLYAFTLDALLAAELRTVVSVQIFAGDTPVSCTLQYSADTYGNNKTGKLLELCKALFAYSNSAKNYFA